MKLNCRPASTPEDIEAMRVIRNSCRTFMTRNQKEISAEEQMFWWNTIDKNDVRPFVFFTDESAAPVGYGLLRRMDDRWWCSGGIAPEYRDKGLGTQLFEHLVSACPSEYLWLEVQFANARAKRVYEKLGFETVNETRSGTVVVMKRHRSA